MATMILGIGELGASRTPGDIIKTLALGSCVGIVMLDPTTRTAGLVHVALPESKIASSLEEVKKLPGRFADTGVPALFEEMKRVGANQDIRKYTIKLAGGAKIMDMNDTFQIGKRNVLAIKKALWALGTGVVSEDVGGTISRTVTIDLGTGVVSLSSPRRENWRL